MQGLECEDISMTEMQFGPKCFSPRSWDSEDSGDCCHSASTSDSQQSEGMSPLGEDEATLRYVLMLVYQYIYLLWAYSVYTLKSC